MTTMKLSGRESRALPTSRTVVVPYRASVSSTVMAPIATHTPLLNSLVYVPHIWSLFVGRFITILYLLGSRLDPGVESHSIHKRKKIFEVRYNSVLLVKLIEDEF